MYGEPLKMKELPTPQPTPGSAVVRILYAPIISYMRDVYNGKRQYGYPTPFTPGTNAIGRIVALGPDAVVLKTGDLVYFDSTIAARDDPGVRILSGLSQGQTEESRRLMEGEWRESTYAEYARLPLENLYALDEKRLMGKPEEGGLGYKPEHLCFAMQALVPLGGLRSIGLQAGETVVVAPATGGFGGSAVIVALAMGARVIAMGRNAEALAGLKEKLGSGTGMEGRLETVQMTGDVETELQALKKFGRIDAVYDISPREAQHSTHLKSAILSLRPEGRVSLMGGFSEDVAIPHRFVMRFDITIKGKWMYSRADNLNLWNMIMSGVLNFRKVVNMHGAFKLEDWEEAFEVAASHGRLGDIVIFTP
jgi:threonine dehydrogenase-like Zn-dependent dehydrogenase